MAKSTPKKRQRAPLHPDTQALLFLAAGFLTLLSLASFVHLAPKENWLGPFGYFLAFGLVYLFGLPSFFIPLYFIRMAIRCLSRQKQPHSHYDFGYFLIFLSSICLLCTAIADQFPGKAQNWEKKVVSEKLILYSPYPRTLVRHNLGGVPFYFLYSDLPFFSLKKLLSAKGTALIFASLGIVAFFLLTRIRVMPVAITIQKGLMALCKSTAALMKYLFHLIRTSKKEAPLPKKTAYAGLILDQLKLKSADLPLKKKVLPPAPETPVIKTTLDLPKKEPLSPLKKETIPVPAKSLIVHANSAFKLPPISLLADPSVKVDQPTLKKDLMQQASVLEETLKSFGIEAKVGEIHSGPTITSFEVHPSIGVKVQKIKALENDIALNMQAKSIRIVAPIPGKAAVGVEVPAIHPQEVNFKEMLLHYQQKTRKMQIPILLGKAINGDWVLSDLAKMPHLLIAGATGSGKSVCVNSIVMSILMNARPEEIKLLMVDPKKVELTQYSKLPHMIAPVITEPHGAYSALQWLVKEMQLRYEILKQLGLRNISAFNSRKINKDLESSLSMPIPEQMPMIVAIVDEFADLMMVSSADIETPIARIAQMARAVGIHLILATQRPSREVITGIIKANIPTRISFKVASRINSQIILDETGAENLLGNGDLLFLPPGTSQLMRAQGAYISDEEINQVVKSLTSQGPPQYLIPSFDAFRSLDSLSDGKESQGKDPLYDQALSIVLGSKLASTTFLQRKLKIGYARAASLMDELETNGIIGPQEGAKPRRVLASSQNVAVEEEEHEELS